ncbi:hypothetical protein [Hymenobacter sp. AT01-02]|uniref:hypothetical protein n=1 Tax=Hymenobacter sp. AT01-02 TaxID=1571877 RepID=UPI000A47746B|nr:hypothetical protein [Hymenobacter sp. AT01-02]
MKAPLTPGTIVPPRWTRTSTVGGAFLAMSDAPHSFSPAPTGAAPDTPGIPEQQKAAPAKPLPSAVTGTPMPAASVPEGYANEPIPELGFRPLLPPPPEVFALVRSEDGRLSLTNDALEIQGQTFGWRELAGVDVQPVRWLLWFLLGGFTLAGFMLGFLQNWLHTGSAALGIASGALLLAWGMRGTNRWRLHRPGREAAYFAFSGAAQSWQQLATEANRRIRQRHDEAAADAAYWLATNAPVAAPPTSPSGQDSALTH